LKKRKLVQWEEHASGVRGITLKDDTDEVIGMVSVNDMNSEILSSSENGYGKRSSV
jgi:DNA gyrase subunit A